jgi:hypothetical protein
VEIISLKASVAPVSSYGNGGGGGLGVADIAALRDEMQRLREANAQVIATARATGGGTMSGMGTADIGALTAAIARAEAAEREMDNLRRELEDAKANSGGDGDDGSDHDESEQEDEEAEENKQTASGSTPAKPGAAGATTSASAAAGVAKNPKEAAKLKEQEKLIKDLRGKIRTLEANAAKAGAGAGKGAVATAAADPKAIEAAVEKRQQMLEKKFKKEKEDTEKVGVRANCMSCVQIACGILQAECVSCRITSVTWIC